MFGAARAMRAIARKPIGRRALARAPGTLCPSGGTIARWSIIIAVIIVSPSVSPCTRAFGAPASSDLEQSVSTPLRELLARVARDQGAAKARDSLVAQARIDAAKPILRRPTTLTGIRQSRVPLKYDVRPPKFSALGDSDWEVFCLSQGDNGAGSILKTELPRIAAAATLTAEAPLLERALAQLAELATWEPLERRGWSLSNAKPRLQGDDGAWLGTGWLVRAIADTVDILTPEKMPQALAAALRSRLAAELALMEGDWQSGRPWYVRAQAAHSNQWILPNEALVRACLFLGPDAHREAYERGIANLLRSMDLQGPDGEFVEGLRYSGLSLESLYSIARATARAGDDRLRKHPFLRRFPTWLAHHFQPGGFLINAFDSPGSSRGNLSRDQGLLATAAVVSGNPHAIWALRTRAGFGDTLDAIIAANVAAQSGSLPPLHAHYTFATRLNWRSSWDDDAATGLWIRGGHPTDFHDHMDRGHVNFIIGKRPILIEAGTLTYAVPNNATHLRSVAGHNVLQIGDAAPDRLDPSALKHAGQILTREHRPAPITVAQMDGAGGIATVDVSKCYASVARWLRRVEWDSVAVTVDDDLELKEDDIAQFRWHLGVLANAAPSTTPGRIDVGDIVLTYEGDQPLVARIEPMPDATLESGKITEHACVVLRTTSPVKRLKLKTNVGLTAAPARR